MTISWLFSYNSFVKLCGKIFIENCVLMRGVVKGLYCIKKILIFFRSVEMASPRIDLDSPIWDQSTFMGRLKYFAWVTDPRLSMSSTSTLLGAKHLVQMYRFVFFK